MNLFTNTQFSSELQDVAKLFYGVCALTECDQADIVLQETCEGSVFCYSSRFADVFEHTSVNVDGTDNLQSMRLRKRYAKVCLYNCLVKATEKTMPWGSLTGIRPTKLARQLISEGLDWENTFTALLGVSRQKTQLVKDILAQQTGLYGYRQNTADLYVGVPFCVSRCSYCSFTSGELQALNKYVDPYVESLCKDVRATLDFAKNHSITIRNVYFGGGTPTSLTTTQLQKVIKQIDVVPVEFTVEAGRPDTFDEEKLKMLANSGVHRISVNPQTFNQSTLDVVGRRHTVQDIYDKYLLAKKYNFVVNMDLIAGLPSETYEMFCNSVNSAVALSPDNITIHTLALKQGSVLKQESYSASEQTVTQMVEYAHKALYGAGYVPYYMYRQKYVCDNLENVGFCKNGKACLYNIDIMEEVSDILACGTNAISKRLFLGENRLERSANAKDVITYIERNEDYLAKKFKLFE